MYMHTSQLLACGQMVLVYLYCAFNKVCKHPVRKLYKVSLVYMLLIKCFTM